MTELAPATAFAQATVLQLLDDMKTLVCEHPSRSRYDAVVAIRQCLQAREKRRRFSSGSLFSDPAWDMLLDLAAARAEHKQVSVTSLCIASGVPPTTALRWIGQLTATGLLERVEDATDRRRAFITLSDTTADAVARYFAELGQSGTQLI